METAAQNKAWIAKIVGSGYFVLLGFTYSIMQLASGHFAFMDFGVMLWVCLPLLLNKRWLYVVFGSLNLAIWLFAAIKIMAEGADVLSMAIISGVSLLSIVAALLLIYSAVHISGKRFSLV